MHALRPQIVHEKELQGGSLRVSLHARLSGLCVRILTLDVFLFAVQVYQEEGMCKYGCWRFKVVEEAERGGASAFIRVKLGAAEKVRGGSLAEGSASFVESCHCILAKKGKRKAVVST